MATQGWFFFLGTAFMVLAETSLGQTASHWRAYKVADGLPESACVSVTLGPHGRVLVRHLNLASISELDGYTVSVVPASETGQNRVYESPGGRQLWTVVPGGLQEFKNGTWMLHPVQEIAAEFDASAPRSTHPVPLYPFRQDRVIFLLRDRLMEFNAESPSQPRTEVLQAASQTRLETFSSMAVARDGGLWIAGARGLARVPGPVENLKPGSQCQQYVPPPSLQLQNLQEPNEDEEGGVTVVAESSSSGRKMVAHFDGRDWTAQLAGTEEIRRAWRGPDKAIWVATADALFRLEEDRPETVENEEIAARKYFDLAVEPAGTFWLATSDGLFHYALSTWRIPGPVRKISSAVRGLAEDAEGRLWFISGNELHALQDDRDQEYSLPGTMARSVPASLALFPLKSGPLLLDAGDQLFQFQPGSNVFRAVSPGDGGRRRRALGLLTDGRLCLQSFSPGASKPDYRLELYDGIKFQPFPDPPPEPVLTGDFSTLFAAEKGDLWLGGERGIAWYHDKKWQTFSPSDTTCPAGVLGFAELTDGRIWAAAPDTIWQFDGRNWSPAWPGFDHINAVFRSRDGALWVASNGGLHRFFQQSAWVENGVEDGLPGAAVREIYEDQRGRIWAATSHGLSLYHPEADTDPPRTSIQRLTDKESSIPEDATITLRFSGQDKWKQTLRNRLLYSYRLDEREWSPFQEATSVSFSDLPVGKHSFQVRALDRNGNLDRNPARLEFAVAAPWYLEPRLLVIGFSGLVVAIFFAGLAVNRHRQLLRSYAEVEKKVAERTSELEIANRALLHSQKMNALGTLAAGIAHDFNNILSIVKGSAQIIEDNLDNPSKVRIRVDRIKTVVEQGAGIVKAMLGFSRSSGEQAGLCDLNAVADDTIKLLGDRFVREVEVNFERTPNLPEVPASKDFIQQILLNFILNAAESMAATARRKQVILATRQMNHLPVDMVLMPARTAAYVSISVQDFGCGIPPENLPRVFDPFFTTKALSVRRGTGLGLSMAYELAQQMEAGLAVESVVDLGSTFTLILPVRDLPANSNL